jgi:NAD(P)-dependent dehydrogenase (short-subunit alcohol dehydrogenase family)
VEKFGKLDILVNCAGIGDIWQGLEMEFSTEKYESVIKTDLGSVFFMIKYSYPEMKKAGGGSIVSISSIAAMKCFGVVPYSAAKGAIRSMDRSLARELGALNIRINSIYPGTVLTEMSEILKEDKELLDMQIAMTAIGRVGIPEDIAYCALYLASDVSTFVTGQAFVVDGGTTC